MRAGVVKHLVVALGLAAVLWAAVAETPPAAGQQPLVFHVIWFLGFNTTLPPFDNVAGRQAVASALDRVKLAAVSENTVAVGIEPPGCMAHNPNARHHPYNVERAKELLGQSGLNLEEVGDVSIWHLAALRGRAIRRQEMETLRDNIAAIGFRPTLREFGNYNALERIATLPVVKMSYWGVLSASPACVIDVAFLGDLVHSKGELNYFGFKNADVDRMIAQAKQSNDRGTKVRLFQEVEQKVIDEAVIVPVWRFSLR